MGQVQDPEELAQELSASLVRCVPGSWAGDGWPERWWWFLCERLGGGGAGEVVYSSGILGVHLCTGVLPRKHCGQVGGQKEDRIGSGCEPISPHSCTRALGLWEQLQFLREELEQVAKKGRARRAQSAKLNTDLCKAHRWVPRPW